MRGAAPTVRTKLESALFPYPAGYFKTDIGVVSVSVQRGIYVLENVLYS